MHFDYVSVLKNMILPNHPAVKDGLSPNLGKFELLYKILMDFARKILESAVLPEDERSRKIRLLSGSFRIYTNNFRNAIQFLNNCVKISCGQSGDVNAGEIGFHKVRKGFEVPLCLGMTVSISSRTPIFSLAVLASLYRFSASK